MLLEACIPRASYRIRRKLFEDTEGSPIAALCHLRRGEMWCGRFANGLGSVDGMAICWGQTETVASKYIPKAFDYSDI